MFSATLQPGIVSLFSSTSSDPLFLFSTHIDESLPSDSLIHFVDDETSEPGPPHPASLIKISGTGHALCQTVLHLQSPTLPTTFIQSPPHGSDYQSLGLKHPWIHFQIRNLERECSIEIGIVDQMGREGRIRLSTFQKDPQLNISPSKTTYNDHLLQSSPSNHSSLLHLPLNFPSSSSRPLTSWATITLNIPSFLPYFTALANTDYHSISDDSDLVPTSQSIERSIILRTLPNGTYSHVSYVRVYATCRLRRIWSSEASPSQSHSVPWEFELYGGGV
ncbi:hypothetical protein E1B28_006118 [Marasmius oreades]|uniref:CFA20 domain-containing protein n=1 Tax=Marasmius oreades TaxID=181124 RepID=A0A9P7UWB6_9AGAR|nr:uncharacterized protein E1B28_006118 [Marasmius oreades]KAG7095359.1 hypothetical protein E1B28_006118 [Marasmius oreades]